MLDITRFKLPTRSVTAPEYTRHGHLPVTLSDTFSTSVLLQLPLSAAALPPIWSCYKTRGDRFGTLQSMNYGDRPEQPFARSVCRRATNFEVRCSAHSQRSERSQAPDTNDELLWQTEIQFSASVQKKNQIWGSPLLGVSNLGADIKVGYDILYEHVGYRPRRRNPIADKAA